MLISQPTTSRIPAYTSTKQYQKLDSAKLSVSHQLV